VGIVRDGYQNGESTKEAGMSTQNIWEYSDETWSNVDLVGFSVEALDGSIGKIDDASHDVGVGYVVVDTGPWIFGKKVMLPAGVIDAIDLDETCVYVQRTKDEIKSAPEFDPDRMTDTTYREQFGTYYGPGGAGHRVGTRDFSRPIGSRGSRGS
jgi:hypothetical protein